MAQNSKTETKETQVKEPPVKKNKYSGFVKVNAMGYLGFGCRKNIDTTNIEF